MVNCETLPSYKIGRRNGEFDTDVTALIYVTAPPINKENQVTYFTEAALTFAANDLPKYRAAINRTGGSYAGRRP